MLELEQPAQKPRLTRSQIVSLTACFIVALFEKVFLKRSADTMAPFALSLNLLLLCMYAVVFSYFYWRRHQADSVSPASTQFPRRKLLTMALLDALAALLLLLPASQLAGAAIVTVLQLVLPLQMLFARCLLKKSYHIPHVLAAVLLVAGVVVVVLPELLAFNDGGWQLLPLLASVTCAAASATYQERELAAVDMDMSYFQFWMALYQAGFSLLLWLPLYPLQTPVASPAAALPANFVAGIACFFGVSSKGAICEDAAWTVFIYFLLLIAFNYLTASLSSQGLIRHVYGLLALVLPLQFLLFSVPIPSLVSHPRETNVVGLTGIILVCLGLGLYRMTDNDDEDRHKLRYAAVEH